MLNPQVAATVCTLSPLNISALKRMVLPQHRIPLPLPPADRDQWCMRLDSTIAGHNQLTTKWADISNGVRRDWRSPQKVDEVMYEGPELFDLRDRLSKRVDDSQAVMLSIAAMLVLDERARAEVAAPAPVAAVGGQAP